jgi:hypothetical protein
MRGRAAIRWPDRRALTERAGYLHDARLDMGRPPKITSLSDARKGFFARVCRRGCLTPCLLASQAHYNVHDNAWWNGLMRSERLTILLTPATKAAIEARARALGITSSELARRAVEAYDPSRNDEALQILADELAVVVEQTEAKVDAALAELQAMREYFGKVDRGRSRALG